MHTHTKAYTVTFLYIWDVGYNSHGLCIHIQNTSQIKYSPSKRRQNTSHLHTTSLLSLSYTHRGTLYTGYVLIGHGQGFANRTASDGNYTERER